MSGGASAFDVLALGAGLALILAGLGLMARACVALLAAKADPYRRLLAVVTRQSLAAGLIAAGLALAFASFAVLIGLGLIALILAAALPVLAQAGANGAHAGGVEPQTALARAAADRPS
jgi:multisubunit Na+/H+ antiporter MnhG subunit